MDTSIEKQDLLTNYHKLMEEFGKEGKSIVAEHVGTFSQAVLVSLIPDLESTLGTQNESVPTIKKVVHITIEAVQNIIFHSERMQSEIDNSAFMLLGHEPGAYHLHTANIIAAGDAQQVAARFEAALSASEEELQELFDSALREAKLSVDGRAGLGIITLALKAMGNVKFDIQSTSEQYSLLHLHIAINT